MIYPVNFINFYMGYFVICRTTSSAPGNYINDVEYRDIFISAILIAIDFLLLI